MTIDRRHMLIGLSGLFGLAVASCGGAASTRASTTARSAGPRTPIRHAYGSDPSQFVELYRPGRAVHPGVVVVIHGGFWLDLYDLSLGAPLAADLAARGYTAVNVEYRRIGDGGGWPTTLLDIAAAIDQLADLGLDTSHVVAVGHSAGGQLAAWAAGRGRLPRDAPGGGPKVAVTAVVSQAGVLDLATAQRQGVGDGAVTNFVGGTPAQFPDRYADADPIQQVPLAAPVLCVHSRTDQSVPFAQSTAYVAAATAAGARASLTEVEGDHLALIDPSGPAWARVVAALPALLTA